MLNQQIAQLVMWIGVIMIIPALYRFVYAASALTWRRLFPSKIFEVRFYDEESNTQKSVVITLPKDRRASLVSLIDEAVSKEKQADVHRK